MKKNTVPCDLYRTLGYFYRVYGIKPGTNYCTVCVLLWSTPPPKKKSRLGQNDTNRVEENSAGVIRLYIYLTSCPLSRVTTLAPLERVDTLVTGGATASGMMLGVLRCSNGRHLSRVLERRKRRRKQLCYIYDAQTTASRAALPPLCYVTLYI